MLSHMKMQRTKSSIRNWACSNCQNLGFLLSVSNSKSFSKHTLNVSYLISYTHLSYSIQEVLY